MLVVEVVEVHVEKGLAVQVGSHMEQGGKVQEESHLDLGHTIQVVRHKAWVGSHLDLEDLVGHLGPSWLVEEDRMVVGIAGGERKVDLLGVTELVGDLEQHWALAAAVDYVEVAEIARIQNHQ